VETNQLDEVDRQLLHALLVAPRASFRLLAEAVGVSDQTIARRYRRMAQAPGLRVLGVINGERAGWADWLIRIQAAPGGAQRIADTLARRPDTRWVRLLSGGTEIACVLQARTPEQRNTVFLEGLPGSRHVTGIAAHSILHVFSSVAWGGYASALTTAQLAVLAGADADGGVNADAGVDVGEGAGVGADAGVGAGAGSGADADAGAGAGAGAEAGAVPGAGSAANATALRADDDPLIAELARDGRASVAALAAATHWHESTVRRRIDELQQAGVLYFDVDVDEALLGVGVNVMLWLSVEPAHLEAAGRAVGLHPEVPFAAATTGPANLVVTAVFRDNRQLYAYLTTKLAGIPGVRSIETTPVIGTLKRSGTRELIAPVRPGVVPRLGN
jgi:DNA-binding Lrp family transcriptional regulator